MKRRHVIASAIAANSAIAGCTITMDQNTVTAIGTITALGLSLVTLVLVPWMTARRAAEERRLADLDRATAARERQEAKEEMVKSATKMEGVEKMVDGKMKEMVEIASNLAGAKATAEEKQKQEDLAAARAEGALTEGQRRDANSAAAVTVSSPEAEKKLDKIVEKTDELTFSNPGEVDAGKKLIKGDKGDPGPPGPPAKDG